MLRIGYTIIFLTYIVWHNQSDIAAAHTHDQDDHTHPIKMRSSTASGSSQHEHVRHLNANNNIERCGARDPSPSEYKKASNVVAMYMKKKLVQQQSDLVSYPFVEVDTYFHVITDGANGMLSNAQLQDQLQVLNESYDPYGFTFRLLGTTTTDNSSWYRARSTSSAQTEMKRALRTGDASTLNVYFNAPQGSGVNQLLGYATLPWTYEKNPDNDGVVVNFNTLPFGDLEGFNEGKTLVHEVGHWLGLYHTFNTNFGSFPLLNILLYIFKIRNGCNTSGDDISDTPRQRSSTRGCPIGRDSCPLSPGLDPISNYMDYSDDSCYSSFTPGQQDRMMAMWEEYRAV